MNEAKRPAHRPTIYTKELGLEICKKIADGDSLLKISKEKEMPSRSTIHLWILTNEEFSHKYDEAVNVRTENMADALNDIADNTKGEVRSEEHTSELQSHSFISYAVFCLKKKKGR